MQNADPEAEVAPGCARLGHVDSTVREHVGSAINVELCGLLGHPAEGAFGGMPTAEGRVLDGVRGHQGAEEAG